MEKEIREKYIKAGKIAKEAKSVARKFLKDGVAIVEIAEKVEEFIRSKGGEPAFPLNISINDVAAHYTPDVNDDTVLKQGDLVKVDIGVHVDGYIADTAFTVCIGEKSHPLIDVAKATLEEFLKMVKPGMTVKQLSHFVESTIEKSGFKPIRNLAGHGLERYVPHAEPSIPNGAVNIETKLEKGMVIAMEVFVTDGAGWVKESYPALIYRYLQEKPVRLKESRMLLQIVRDEFHKLPFTKRWLVGRISPLKMNLAFSELISKGALYEYPLLKERNGGLVAQWEETFILDDKPTISTLLD